MSSTGGDRAAGAGCTSTEERRDGLLATYARNVGSRLASAGPPERYIHFGHWDVAPQPGTEKEHFPAAQERLDAELRGLAHLESGLSVLDAGCGFGGTLGAIDADFERMRLVGLNLDPRQLAVAAGAVVARPINTLQWIEGDASELAGFADASFDRILAVECIVHFASRRRFVQHAARVLRRPGRLVLSDIVATPELRALRGSDRIPFDVDRIVASGLRPWPDFWGDDVDYAGFAAACDLRLDAQVDATTATLPSYRAIVSDVAVGPETHPGDEGMLLLEWLQTRGLIRVLYLAFQSGAA